MMRPFPVSRLISTVDLSTVSVLLLTLGLDQIEVLIFLYLSGWRLALLFPVLEMSINKTHHDFLVLPSEFKSIKIDTMFNNIPETVQRQAS